MNAQTPIIAEKSPKGWDCIDQEVALWRDSVLQCFCRAEEAVNLTLACLAGVPARGEAVSLRHLIGQRLDDCSAAVAADGPFAEEGKKALKALQAFRRHEPLRVYLAHGVSRIAREKDGCWLLVLRYGAFRARRLEYATLVVSEAEAGEQLRLCRADTQRLCAVLANLRKTLEG